MKHRTRPRNLKLKYPVVYVEWLDAANHRGWRSKEDALETKPACNATIGFLIKEEKDQIWLAFSCSLNPDKDGFYPFSDVMVIPKVWIKKTISMK